MAQKEEKKGDRERERERKQMKIERTINNMKVHNLDRMNNDQPELLHKYSKFTVQCAITDITIDDCQPIRKERKIEKKPKNTKEKTSVSHHQRFYRIEKHVIYDPFR